MIWQTAADAVSFVFFYSHIANLIIILRFYFNLLLYLISSILYLCVYLLPQLYIMLWLAVA